MPLAGGTSREAFAQNVKTEMNAGKPQDQALAIAYAKQRAAGKDEAGVASLAPNSGIPMARKARAEDMSKADWRGLLRGLFKFLSEESEEPEHKSDDCEPNAKDAAPGRVGAATIFQSPLGRVLVIKRSPNEENFAGHWGLPGGMADEGETPEQAARREAVEELGEAAPEGPLISFDERVTPTGVRFCTFLQKVDEEFTPRLNNEHTAFKWVVLDDLPEPMHPAVLENLSRLKTNVDRQSANDSAPDELGSVREKDRDGHLHISRTPITRAVVSEYYGREIAGSKELGLDPDKKYKLYRDLDELKKGADSAVGKPILLKHQATSADDHPREITIGAIGGPIEIEGDTVYAPLTIWDAEAIRGIENETKKSLSLGYWYKLNMQPGVAPDGTRYDGRMRDIEINHLALVEQPRVQGAMVADSAAGFSDTFSNETRAEPAGKTSELPNMPISETVARRVNAIRAFVAPRLAKDASLDGLEHILALDAGPDMESAEEGKEKDDEDKKNDLTDKKAKDRKAKDEDDMGEETKGVDRKAKDAAEEEAEKKAMDAKRAYDRKARDSKRAMDRKARDEEGEGIKSFLKAKLGAEDYKKACDALEEERKAMDAEMDEERKAHDGVEDDDKKATDKFPKMGAHDQLGLDEASVRNLVEEARIKERKLQSAIYDARKFVRPIVGELTLAFDSAEDVYAHTLRAKGVKIDGVHSSAYRVLLEQVAKGSEKQDTKAALAFDSSSRSTAEKYAPGLKNIQIGV